MSTERICACGRVVKPNRKRPGPRADRADGVRGKLIYFRRCVSCRRSDRYLKRRVERVRASRQRKAA